MGTNGHNFVCVEVVSYLLSPNTNQAGSIKWLKSESITFRPRFYLAETSLRKKIQSMVKYLVTKRPDNYWVFSLSLDTHFSEPMFDPKLLTRVQILEPRCVTGFPSIVDNYRQLGGWGDVLVAV